MARITREDCIYEGINSKFILVLVAVERAKEIIDGDDILIDKVYKNDKETVSALREIAKRKINIPKIKHKIAKKLSNDISTIAEEYKKYLDRSDDIFNKVE